VDKGFTFPSAGTGQYLAFDAVILHAVEVEGLGIYRRIIHQFPQTNQLQEVVGHALNGMGEANLRKENSQYRLSDDWGPIALHHFPMVFLRFFIPILLPFILFFLGFPAGTSVG
jgi:hypothetical protein